MLKGVFVIVHVVIIVVGIGKKIVAAAKNIG
jgi:hypothetical protein